jgi:dTDP-4-dehydrorhamnose 3,5-epimerase-like enzyme
MTKPSIIQFPKNGSSDIGFLGIVENGTQIPFDIKRVFWAYFTPDSVVRGRHAHHDTQMILIAAAGRIVVTTEMPNEPIEVFTLEKPNEGLYIPKYCWHTMQYSHNAVQLVLASSNYLESDYIRDYEEFKKL